MERDAIAKQFGREEGFDLVSFYKKWNGYFVYTADIDGDEVMFGPSPFILIDEQNRPHIATPDDVLAIYNSDDS